ncbi:MAG: hypothetical protein V4577_27100 [Bacteroidota bacterium]
MPQTKPGIATTILAPLEDGEGFVEISPNKTLFIQKLTYDDPIRPVVVEDLRTVEDVFDRFKPSCEVELDRKDGSTISETFSFGKLSDFDTKNLVGKSEYLKDLNFKNDTYLKMAKQLGSNKTLNRVLENPETKKAFIDVLTTLIAELEA